MTKKLIAGFIGSLALNAIHEIIRKNDDSAPRINEVGEEVLNKYLSAMDVEPIEDKDKSYLATLAADVFSNGLYYASTVSGTGTLSGLLAGLGAVYLPKKLGLNDEPVAGTDKKKAMTVGYYIAGALVTALVYKMLSDKNK